MERLKALKEQLMSCVEGQMNNLCDVDAHELGEAVDMIKDCYEAMYYYSLVKAMEDKTDEEISAYHDYYNNKMYYTPRKTHRHPTTVDDEYEYPVEMRDYREGTSPMRRKYYMEAKELHQDKKTQMEELEKYMRELSKDITEMIQDASPEETTLLKQKLAMLVEKIK